MHGQSVWEDFSTRAVWMATLRPSVKPACLGSSRKASTKGNLAGRECRKAGQVAKQLHLRSTERKIKLIYHMHFWPRTP
jgi:hypothetical protein